MIRARWLTPAAILLTTCSPTPPDDDAAAIDWPAYAADGGATRFSPAVQITSDNVRQLRRVWTWRTGETAQPFGADTLRPGRFEATPVAIGDTLWLTTSFAQVVALDARTGRELWRYDPQITRYGAPMNDHAGFVHRGVALWNGPRGRRVLVAIRWWLVSLDAATGRLDSSFGEAGRVDLAAGLSWPVERRDFSSTSPPVVWRNIVVVGSSIGDGVIYDRDPPGDVQAFDAGTGRRLWRWSPMPQPGDPARRAWGEAAERTGHMNVWAPFTADTARGLLYLPVSAASNDWYGGRRPGDNRYAESVVCLDASTGRMVWHYQLVHHGVWDYDPASPPVLVTVRRDSGDIPAVLVAGKTGFVYGFNRVTGAPLWPIDERPVPASDVPGEQLSPTQPFPRLPAPFARQGFSDSDVVDFTPELRASALRSLAGRRMGPLFTPPSREGSVISPGWIGGAGWGATAADEARGLLFVKASNEAGLVRLVEGTPDVPWRIDTRAGNPITGLSLWLPAYRDRLFRHHDAVRVPLGRPPYGTLTAIDLTTGQHRWQVTVGDRPDIRQHPALRHLKLPPLGIHGAPGPLATASGLLFLSGGGATLIALRSDTGEELWSADLGERSAANPATYVTTDGRQFVVIASGAGTTARLHAFALRH